MEINTKTRQILGHGWWKKEIKKDKNQRFENQEEEPEYNREYKWQQKKIITQMNAQREPKQNIKKQNNKTRFL